MHERLDSYVARYADEYQQAKPFAHVVIDDFLPKQIAQQLLDDFPSVASPAFVNRSSAHQPNKYGTVKADNLKHTSAFIQHFLHSLISPEFCAFISQLTSIPDIVPDPHFHGGGLHQIVHGGKLDVHADFNFEPHIKLYRRVNLLLYLNPHWQENYGGYLELWDGKTKAMTSSIAPIFNRCVMFSTSKDSYHGHPEPLKVPPDITRKSIAVYYYTKDPIKGQEKQHSTLWLG